MGAAMQLSERIGRRMKLQDLHVLMTVVQAGSMGKAAERLTSLSPPFRDQSRSWNTRWACACSIAAARASSPPSTVARYSKAERRCSTTYIKR